MLIEQIKSDALEARKSHKNDTATLLVTLYSEASMIGKNAGNRQSTDAEVLQVIEKFVKNAMEVKNILIKNDKDTNKIEEEIKLFSSYLPQKMTQEELEKIIKMIVSDFGLGEKSPELMGQVMKILKGSYGGTYDGKMASEIVKKELMS